MWMVVISVSSSIHPRRTQRGTRDDHFHLFDGHNFVSPFELIFALFENGTFYSVETSVLKATAV